MSRKDAGLTLLEVLVALLVLGIVTTIAYPAYQSAWAKTRITKSQATLQNTITVSMRDAVVTRRTIVLCPSLDGNTCTNGADWSHGWISFADLDKDRLRSPEEPIVVSLQRPEEGVRIIGSAGRPRLVFRVNGTTPGTNTTFTTCAAGSRAPAIALVLANSGQLRRAGAGEHAAERCMGDS